ncbi:hypothetical protein BpHYR1_016250 [Brachionus plicatilis]|uniref:Uncharacterized protein n=1 Tax=Brachionus plicatilis TaxID=10195 RepID=A0A3M7RIQ5_BRAPC|nr:hypothetical protein BpHYR1_016250 [Brachionus plicatilis]
MIEALLNLIFMCTLIRISIGQRRGPGHPKNAKRALIKHLFPVMFWLKHGKNFFFLSLSLILRSKCAQQIIEYVFILLDVFSLEYHPCQKEGKLKFDIKIKL